MKILAGIVTYNPDLNRLRENILSIIPQVDQVYIVDNGSRNVNDIVLMTDGIKNSAIKGFDKNRGIAAGLKDIMDHAIKYNFDWCITLDQDSIAQCNLIKTYRNYVRDDIGAMTCNVKDRNFTHGEQITRSVRIVKSCLTSGCFMNVDAYKKTNGYDTRMFIDCVDFDICFSLEEHGYKIIQVPYLGLLHEIGNAKDVTFIGRKTQTFNHPAWRRYYANRNLIYLAKKHPSKLTLSGALGRCAYKTVLILFNENDKLEKLKMNLKGIIDGLKMKVG